MAAAVYQVARNDPVREDATVVVNVLEKMIQRLDALVQPFLDSGPVGRRNNARQTVDRKYPFGRLGFAIDRESDALVEEGVLAGTLALGEFLGAELRQTDGESGGMVAVNISS